MDWIDMHKYEENTKVRHKELKMKDDNGWYLFVTDVNNYNKFWMGGVKFWEWIIRNVTINGLN